jgi:hypothetical protein
MHDVLGQHVGLGLLGAPEREQHRRLEDEQHPERADELGKRRRVAQRPERDELGRRADREHDPEAEYQRRPGREVQQVDPQRPEGVAGEHREPAGGQVDDSRAAVGEHNAERDPGDQRARAEPEQRVQQYLCHLPGCHRDACHDGGCNHPADFTNTCLPLYRKNCVLSLHTAGALEYLPQSRDGAPRATGPVNALALASTADGVI